MWIQADDFVRGADAAPGLRAALAAAAESGAQGVAFAAREYRCETAQEFPTLLGAHDEGCGLQTARSAHLRLQNAAHFTLRGAVDAAGRPATRLVGANPETPQALLPVLLWAENCPGLTLENITFTRSPAAAGTALVESVAGGEIVARPIDGKTYTAPAGAYCMNRFDPQSRALLGASLTNGFGYDTRWQPRADGTLLLHDPALAARLRPGEGVSWHQAGKTDFLLYLGQCDALRLQNLRIENTNGFAILTECCAGITASRVDISPAGAQFFTGPRDGWKISRCAGQITVEDCRFEGVRMDGQNVHSNYLIVQKLVDAHTMLCKCRYAPHPLKTGSGLLFTDRNDCTRSAAAAIANWTLADTRMAPPPAPPPGDGAAPRVGQPNRVNTYRIRVEGPLPPWAGPGTLVQALCWEPAQYTCRRSVFKNIAGAGHLLRCRRFLLEENRYENLMNAGVLLGAELDTHTECGNVAEGTIRKNTFRNIGAKPRYGVYGCACIAVKAQGMRGPYNRRLQILENTFAASPCAVELNDAADVCLSGNRYEGVAVRCKADPLTTQNVQQGDGI